MKDLKTARGNGVNHGLKADYKLPKIFFTKDKDGNPTIVKGEKWHVYFSFLEPGTDKYKLFKRIHTLNTGTTVEERMEIGLQLVAIYTHLLVDLGFNPFRPSSGNIQSGLETYAAEYVEEKRLTLAQGTARQYETTLKLLVQHFTGKDQYVKQVCDITKNDIKKYVIFRADERKWQPKTFNEVLSQLGQFFAWVIDQDNPPITVNPVDRIPRRPVTSEANPPLNDEVFHAVMKEARETYPYFYFFYRLMYYSCLRPVYEARLLKVGHIDVTQMMIHIPASISKTGKKLGKGRSLPMAAQLLDIFKEHGVIGQDPDHYVFTLDKRPGVTPLGVGYFNGIFNTIRKKLNLENTVDMYAIKHTRVCHLVMDGVPLYRIQELTGHTTLEQLMVYMKGLKLIVDKRAPIHSRDIL